MWRALAAAGVGVVVGVIVVLVVQQGRDAGDSGFPSVDVPGIGEDERVAAMVSVHAHARFPERAPAEFMPLDEAVRILRADAGPAAASRRRRAIAKLAAYDLEGFREQIGGLGGDPELLERQLLSELPKVDVPPQLRQIVLLNYLVFMTPTCQWQVPEPEGAIREDPPPPIQWRFVAEIPRPVHDVARSLDPQSWQQCSPLFESAYLAETEGSCCPFDASNSDCSFSGSQPPVGDAIPRGKAYGSTVFFEHFCHDPEGSCSKCGQDPCHVSFKNLLCVKTKYDRPIIFSFLASWADRFDVDFRLAAGLLGELNGQESEDNLITIDQGQLRVKEDPNSSSSSILETVKTIDLKGTTAAGAVQRALFAFEDEMRGELVEVGCCDVPPEPWGFWSWLFALLDGSS